MAEWTPLQEEFGGSWDGANPEIHGLIERDGETLKVELLYSARRNKWTCSVFEGGSCLGSGAHADPLEAVRRAVKTE